MNWAWGGNDSWRHLSNEYFEIRFTSGDSIYAVNARAILHSAYDEIATDLKVTTNIDISVIICPSRQVFKQLTMGRLPKWVEGVANVRSHSMIIKSPNWDKSMSDFSGTLVHELTHLLFHHAVGYRRIPRWIDEGLAIFYSREEQWASATQISKALLTNSIIPLDQIDEVLTFHREKAKLAYQESYTAVQYLLATYDIDAIQIIIKGIRQGWSWDRTFQQATGSTLLEFEKEWRKYIEKEYRWYWLVEIDTFIWFIVVALFIIGFIVVRMKNRRTLEKWEEEELFDSDEKPG